MATSIFFNGRLISVPGSYSEVDASGLEQIGLGATGIVAVIGTAEGGIPAGSITSVDDFIRITKPEQGRTTFRSGDIREAIPMLFDPANDPDVPGGAVEVVAMKVNPATQSTATLANSYGDSLALTSSDYGAFTSQVNVTIGDGTSQGKLLTITFEDVTESVDDLGGDSMFKIKYTKPTNGWDAMTAEVESGGHLVCDATRDQAGLDGDIATQLASDSAIEIASSDAGDTTQQVVIYGLDGSSAAVSETLNLNGTTVVVGTQVFDKVLGARVIGTTVGTITIDPSGGGADVLTIAPGTNPTKALLVGVTMYVSNSAVTIVADGATTKDLIVVGTSATGAVQLEKFTLTGTTAVVGSGNFATITYIALGDVEAARTLTISAEAARSTGSVQDTLQKVADFYNSKYIASTGGFELTLETGLTSFDPDDLDVTTGAGGAVSCLSPAEPTFYADLWAMIDWINNNSQYVDAAKASGAKGGAVTNTTSPVFLSGGEEGTTAFSHYQAALNLLKQVRVNSIVVLTGDPAVHAAADAHAAYMAGVGRNERDVFVGLMNTGLTDVPSKTEAKSQVVDLNSRHVRAFAQAIERYNTAGERQEFEPYFQAAVAAGMQAGSPIGTPLTRKYANVLSLRQSTSWNPTDDSEEMIQAGLCFMENVDGVGRRVVRNITTHLSSDNIAFTEGSVNEAVNYAVYTFRTAMEYAVGRSGFAGTVNAATGIAIGILGELKDENILVATGGLNIELIVDVLETSVEMAPVLPINFVKNTIHLVTIPQTA
jgi:hypothetical protein